MKQDRTFRDDLAWALAVLVGFALGALVFDAETSILLGAVIAATVVVSVRAFRRR